MRGLRALHGAAGRRAAGVAGRCVRAAAAPAGSAMRPECPSFRAGGAGFGGPVAPRHAGFTIYYIVLLRRAALSGVRRPRRIWRRAGPSLARRVPAAHCAAPLCAVSLFTVGRCRFVALPGGAPLFPAVRRTVCSACFRFAPCIVPWRRSAPPGAASAALSVAEDAEHRTIGLLLGEQRGEVLSLGAGIRQCWMPPKPPSDSW